MINRNVKYGSIVYIPVASTDTISIDFIRNNDELLYSLEDIDTSGIDIYELHISIPATTIVVYDDSSDIIAIFSVSTAYDKYWFLNNSDNVDYPLSKVILQK